MLIVTPPCCSYLGDGQRDQRGDLCLVSRCTVPPVHTVRSHQHHRAADSHCHSSRTRDRSPCTCCHGTHTLHTPINSLQHTLTSSMLHYYCNNHYTFLPPYCEPMGGFHHTHYYAIQKFCVIIDQTYCFHLNHPVCSISYWFSNHLSKPSCLKTSLICFTVRNSIHICQFILPAKSLHPPSNPHSTLQRPKTGKSMSAYTGCSKGIFSAMLRISL